MIKGIILAGGSGTRLHPLTLGISKQMLPIYDKPMIYYPISVLMLANIRKILIISTPDDIHVYRKLLGDGSNLGIEFSYEIQKKPEGLAQALIIGEEFIGKDDFSLILGDNIFYGSGFHNLLNSSAEKLKKTKSAVIFGSYVTDPANFGVVEFDSKKNIISIKEKPEKPKSNFAVVGLYFYPNEAVKIAKNIKPSKRGELEITSVNEEFLKINKLSLELLGRGFAWLDTGTHDNLNNASEFVKAVENRTGLKIACLEEIAITKKWINKAKLKSLIEDKKGMYYDYLKNHFLN